MVKEKAYRVTATFADFDKEGGSMIGWNCDDKVLAWKLAFYEIWRYQMTWQFAYRLEIIDGRENLFVSILCKESFLDSLLNTMDGVGYRNVKSYETKVGMISCLKVPEDVEEIVDFY